MRVQPIDTAPQDGTQILLFNKEVRSWMVGAYHSDTIGGWYSDGFRYFGGFRDDPAGIHEMFWPDWWAPLPEPPPPRLPPAPEAGMAGPELPSPTGRWRRVLARLRDLPRFLRSSSDDRLIGRIQRLAAAMNDNFAKASSRHLPLAAQLISVPVNDSETRHVVVLQDNRVV